MSWSDLDITISVPWYLGLMFRTRKEDGVLMEAVAGASSRLHLQVRENRVHPPPPPRAAAGPACTRGGQPELPGRTHGPPAPRGREGASPLAAPPSAHTGPAGSPGE